MVKLLEPHVVRRIQGRTVKVHRNLQNGLWSITFEGKVVAHALIVHLNGVTFPVSRASRLRVLRDRQKNVHAYAQGQFSTESTAATVPITYDPYQAGYFTLLDQPTPVYTAAQVTLGEHGRAYAYEVNNLLAT